MEQHALVAALGVDSQPNTDGLLQVGELGLALLLSALIGLEREFRQKSAGLRTYTLVGVGAALFTLISKYGFTDVLRPGGVMLDPSRVAAQIVTGVGFLGAGVIFVQRGSVRGLTTAAAIWVTAAIGAAAGAGLPVVAGASTVVYFVVAAVFPLLTRRLPRSATAVSALHVRYPDGQGILRQVLALATAQGFVIDEVSTEALGYSPAGLVPGARPPIGARPLAGARPPIGARPPAGETPSGRERPVAEERRPAEERPLAGERPPAREHPPPGEHRMVQVTMHVHGRNSVNDLAAALSELRGVEAVLADDVNAVGD